MIARANSGGASVGSGVGAIRFYCADGKITNYATALTYLDDSLCLYVVVPGFQRSGRHVGESTNNRSNTGDKPQDYTYLYGTGRQLVSGSPICRV